MLSDHNLTQLIDIPTHRCSHTLDWAVHHSDVSCLILKRVEDMPSLSYHKSLLCLMTITAPSKAKHTVTSQNTKAVSLPDFQADIKCFTDCYSQCPNRDLVDGYSAGLHAIMDCHIPLVTCCISHWCSAPWLTDEVREGPRRRQQAEHFWKSTQLTVYRKIFIREWATMKRCIWDARKLHYSSKIDVCSTTKLLFALMNCSAKQRIPLCLWTFLFQTSHNAFATFSWLRSSGSVKTMTLVLAIHQPFLSSIDLSCPCLNLCQELIIFESPTKSCTLEPNSDKAVSVQPNCPCLKDC